LIEHYAGALPFWISPEQIWIIPITDKQKKYGQLIKEKIQEAGYRVELKSENDTISKKIREGELKKIPYLLIIGEKEMKKNTVSVRERGGGNIGAMKLNKFMKKIEK